MKSITIRTKNRELYNELNSLNFNKEIIIDKDNAKMITKIINTINKNDNMFISKEIVGDKVKIKKHSHINFNVYFN